MSVISARAPLRISLGGGGTDLPSYYSEHGGFLIAGSINKYVYMLIHTVFQRRYRMKYSSFEEVDSPKDIQHPILREAILHHWDGDPLEIASIADVPAGTGMGSSGAYTVCLLKALALAKRTPTTPASLAEGACGIEIDILRETVGKQDQYTAAHGGICSYTFNPDGTVEVDPLKLSSRTVDLLESNLLLFYTGEARSASGILADQVARTVEGDQTMIENLHRTKQIGYESKQLLEDGNLDQYAHLMHEHWENKRVRSPGMFTDRVDELYTEARSNGVVGGKLVGAGGGGFLLVYSDDPEATRDAMRRVKAQELVFGFDWQGCVGNEFR